MRSFVFFIRLKNQMDHHAPVIHFLKDKNFDVKIIAYDVMNSLSKDYRLKLLKSKHRIEISHLYGLISARPIRLFLVSVFRDLYFLCLKISRNIGHPFLQKTAVAVAERIWWGVFVQIQKKTFLQFTQKPNEEGLFAQHSDCVFVFDHTTDDLAMMLAEGAKRRGLPTVALPHAVTHIASEDDLSNYNRYDVVVLPNKNIADRYISCGLDPIRVRTIGSIRFHPAWQSILSRDIAKWKLPTGRNGTRNVLFLSDWGSVYKKQDIIDSVHVMEHAAPTVLLAQAHTGTAFLGLWPLFRNGSRRFTIAHPDIPTFQLIAWADIVVFMGTSVIYDALRLRKQIIFLRHVSEFVFDFENTICGWNANSSAEFGDMLQRCINDPDYRPYTEDEARITLRTLVDNEVDDVPRHYVELLASLQAKQNMGSG